MGNTPIRNIPFANIEDNGSKEAIRIIVEDLNENLILRGSWRFLEIEASAATTKNVKHGFGYIPTDIIHLYWSGTTSVTFNYNSFTDDTISITFPSAGKVRFFVGKYS